MIIGNRKAVLIVGACLLFLLIAPYVSASVDSTTLPVDTTPLAENSPDLIAALKLHAAVLGQDQEARMDGIIAYINNISSGTGASSLQQIKDDYLVIASSIPLMTTNDEITSARDDMRAQTQLFSDETNTQLVIFNGSTNDMRESIASSEQAADASFTDFRDSLWLARDSARLTLFDADSEQRALLLRSLDREGIDTGLARNISDQIDAQRSDLQDALSNNSADALMTANAGIRSLNREFRSTVSDSQAAMAIKLKGEALMSM
ncbi:hypothetical protein [Methanoregula sp.]|uniref:hypothetical protein n=1 Tax=Methanoregula sp. TaxID=2052170 RepID=UPI003C78A72C